MMKAFPRGKVGWKSCYVLFGGYVQSTSATWNAKYTYQLKTVVRNGYNIIDLNGVCWGLHLLKTSINICHLTLIYLVLWMLLDIEILIVYCWILVTGYWCMNTHFKHLSHYWYLNPSSLILFSFSLLRKKIRHNLSKIWWSLTDLASQQSLIICFLMITHHNLILSFWSLV